MLLFDEEVVVCVVCVEGVIFDDFDVLCVYLVIMYLL